MGVLRPQVNWINSLSNAWQKVVSECVQNSVPQKGCMKITRSERPSTGHKPVPGRGSFTTRLKSDIYLSLVQIRVIIVQYVALLVYHYASSCTSNVQSNTVIKRQTWWIYQETLPASQVASHNACNSQVLIVLKSSCYTTHSFLYPPQIIERYFHVHCRLRYATCLALVGH